ncbi:hypothetical protein KP509_35G058100 [Ceratopteris richardii]|uniref:Cyanovirin-N domain-containing protein n=2 Tax=Ceratopteris richardii TaxID=49495 RepID=A0A8T2QHZ6_CERRI|nr:hypothetical protein KP509_35G058100 [Ceratopteris richardii]
MGVFPWSWTVLLRGSLLLVLVSLSTANANCNFASSCKRMRLKGSVLRAVYKDAKGRYDWTSIDLNDSIGNDNGKLACHYYSFKDSCEDLALEDGHTLTASCEGEDGIYHETSVDLNSCLDNEDGELMPCNDGLPKSANDLKSSTG